MTKEEFTQFIEEQKKGGKSEEEIAKVFCLMFRDGELDREQFEAVLEAIGYELTEEFKGKSDEELKDEILVEDKGEEGEGEKVDPDGDMPPVADGDDKGGKEEGKPDGEPKPEADAKPEDEAPSEDEERKRAFRLFGLDK